MACCAACARSSFGLVPYGADPCGQSFAHLVQAQGRTKSNATGNWCNEEDAKAWLGQAHRVAAMVREAASRGGMPADWQRDAAAYLGRVAELPESSFTMAFGMGGCGEAVDAAVGSIEEAACLLERAQAAGSDYQPPGIDAPAPASGWGLAGASTGALIAVLLVLWMMRGR